MEINLNKQEITESSKYAKFSIRKYVAEIRKKDKKKCWPFGSLGDPENDDDFALYQSAESLFLSTNLCFGDTDTPNSSKVELLNRKEDRLETTTGINVCKGSSESEVNNAECLVEDNDESGPQKLRLLSDILLSGLGGPSRVHRRCTQIEEEMDDKVTLGALFRNPTILDKKRTIRVEDPRPVQDIKRLKYGLCGINDSDVGPRIQLGKTRIDDLDTETIVNRAERVVETRARKDFSSNSINTKVSSIEATETANNDSEMEAVMLLARHFNEKKPSTDDRILVELETGSTGCACVQKKIREQLNESNSTLYAKTSFVQMSKAAEHGRSSIPETGSVFRAHDQILVCSVNRNPADFSIPNAENKFMRGC